MKKSALWMSMLAVAIALVCALNEGDDDSVESSKLDTGVSPSQAIQVNSGVAAGRGWAEDLAIGSSLDLVRQVYIANEGKEIHVITREESPLSGLTEEFTEKFGLSYTAEFVEGWSANDFLVVGVGANGKHIFERWYLPPVKGAYEATPLPAPASIGVPMAISANSISVNGAQYIAQEYREKRNPPRRIRVFEGTDFLRVDSLVVDHQARMALVHSMEDNAIYRVRFNEAPEVELLYTQADVAYINEVMGFSRLLRDDGAVLYLFQEDVTTNTAELFWDTDNDGLIDSRESVNDATTLDDLYPQHLFGD